MTYEEMKQLNKGLNKCFCGRGASIHYCESISDDYIAECWFCGARLYGDSPQKAADTWNSMTKRNNGGKNDKNRGA